MKKALTEAIHVEECFMDSLKQNEEAIPNYEEFFRESYKQKERSGKETLRTHLGKDIVFTGTWAEATEERELDGEELQAGEAAAVIFQVGCCTVRSAQRIYKVCDSGYYDPEAGSPADKTDVDLVRKDMDCENAWAKAAESSICVTTSIGSWKDRLRVTNEISAKHSSDPDKVFRYICRAARSGNHTWSEDIEFICTVKEHALIPDEYASLLICRHYEGSSFGSDTWYKLDPTGKITKLEPGAYGIIPDDARFE